MKRILALAAGTMLALPAAAQDLATASGTFLNMAGEENGTAELTATLKGVLTEIEVPGLPPGDWVAFHVHEPDQCDHETEHESDGGHFNPAGAAHGYRGEGGPHAGDMPNQYVGADGTLRAQVFNSFVSLDNGETDIRGRALMIHGGQDDYETQPTGDAGNRQACAVIE